MLKVHSCIGLVTNSSSEVFWIHPGQSIDQIKARIDLLWHMWKDQNPTEAKEDWFSGEVDEIPVDIADAFHITMLSEQESIEVQEHWLGCGLSSLADLVIHLIESDYLEDIVNLLEECKRERGFDGSFYDESNKSIDDFLAFLEIVVNTAELTETFFWSKGYTEIRTYMEEDKARAESCLEIHYLLRIVLSRHLRHQKEDFQSMHYFSFMERDLEYYKAAVPGSIYIDSRYNAAPESFTQFIRSFFMGVGGQLG